MPAEYHHSVFLSYPSKGTIQRWALDFATVLRDELQNLALDDRVFVDRKDLHTGDDWPEALRAAHLRSIAFVPILCAPYFRSGWCSSEWANAMVRAEQVGRRLVFPVWFNDREDQDIETIHDFVVREQVRRTQAADFREHSYDFDPSARTADVKALRVLVRQLCGDLRPVLADPPKWDAGWPVLPSVAASGAHPSWNPRMGGEVR